MKYTHRGFIGLFRAASDAIETVRNGATAGIIFNGNTWIGGDANIVCVNETPVCHIYPNARFNTWVCQWTGILSADEQAELSEHLNNHAESHGYHIEYRNQRP